MAYYFSKTIGSGFDEAVSKVKQALKGEGFGVLTEIDVKETLKQKLDVDFNKYLIHVKRQNKLCKLPKMYLSCI